MRDERGVTLLELMIAITLVAAIVAGLLFALRTSLLAYQKLNGRLEEDARTMRIEQALERQISGLVPLVRDCPALKGDERSLRFVSAYSLAEGSRGYLRVVEYVVAPDPSGGTRLMMNERLYNGPCVKDPPLLDGESIEAAGKLAYCRIGYREFFPDNPMAGNWVPLWDRPTTLPGAVRIEMAPMGVSGDSTRGRLPMLTVNVPIRITRELRAQYIDDER